MTKPRMKAVQLALPFPESAPAAELDEEKIAAALADPVVVWPGWESTVPDWIWQAVTEERLARVAAGGDDDLATLAEVLCYLFTAGLAVPLDYDWAEIYINLAAQYMAARGKADLPDDMRPRPFTDYEETLLRELRHKIRSSQKRARRARLRRGDKGTF